MDTESLGGKVFWVLEVDDCNQMKWSFFIERKSLLSMVVYKLISDLKMKGKTVKCLRLDNEGKNLGMKGFFTEKGVTGLNLNSRIQEHLNRMG